MRTRVKRDARGIAEPQAFAPKSVREIAADSSAGRGRPRHTLPSPLLSGHDQSSPIQSPVVLARREATGPHGLPELRTKGSPRKGAQKI